MFVVYIGKCLPFSLPPQVNPICFLNKFVFVFFLRNFFFQNLLRINLDVINHSRCCSLPGLLHTILSARVREYGSTLPLLAPPPTNKKRTAHNKARISAETIVTAS